jgi:RNA polymerase primary sigma factor
MMRTYVKGLIPTSDDMTDKLYISDIDKVSPGLSGFLTDPAVRVIIKEYKDTKDLKIREQLIHTFGRYVVSIAKNYQNQGLPLCDLISEGMIGLISAIENFDLANETQFMTYANVVISRQMREALDQFNLPVKVPKNIRNQHRKVRTRVEELQIIGTDEDDIQDKFLDNEIDLEYYYNPGLFSKLSVGSVGSDDDQNEDMESIFVSDDVPDSKLTRLDLKRDVSRIFKRRLTKIEAKVLRLYFGIDQPYQIVSTADLGKRLGMSGERARQIKEAGLQKLRAADCREILIKYL